jgi:cytochrome c-type biogenesis protein CcmH/NrfG
MTRNPESPWKDAEPDEAAFLARGLDSEGWTFAGMQRCPPPEMLRAAQEGVLPGGVQSLVAAHVEQCRVCRLLVEALDDPSMAGLTSQEQLRVGRSVRAKTAKAARHGFRFGWAWRAPIPVSVGALFLLMASAWWVLREPVSPPSSARAVVEPAGSPIRTTPSAFTLEKAAVRLPAAAVLVWRGDPDADPERASRDLSSALEPYQRDEFSDAARRLTEVTRQHPKSAGAHFYLGVSDLFLQREVEAIAALETAKRLAGSDAVLAEETAWYLALAYQNTGQREAAARELRPLCEAKGTLATRACAGLQELAVPRSTSDQR